VRQAPARSLASARLRAELYCAADAHTTSTPSRYRCFGQHARRTGAREEEWWIEYPGLAEHLGFITRLADHVGHRPQAVV